MSALEGVSPWGGTPLGARLKEILDAYAKEWAPRRSLLGLGRRAAPRPKPLNILVITDGMPSASLLSPPPPLPPR